MRGLALGLAAAGCYSVGWCVGCVLDLATRPLETRIRRECLIRSSRPAPDQWWEEFDTTGLNEENMKGWA